MDRTDKGISVDADVYDVGGKLVARIAGTDFHVITGENASIDRDHDLSTLTVRDGRGDELFYAKYMNPTTIRFRGVFACHDHAAVVIKDPDWTRRGFIGMNCISNVTGAAFGSP